MTTDDGEALVVPATALSFTATVAAGLTTGINAADEVTEEIADMALPCSSE
jgi:hypothetical protein